MTNPFYIGLILLAGLIGGNIASKFKLPSVTGFIIFGLILGPSFTNIITKDMITKYSFINDLNLGMLSVIIGSQLHIKILRRYGKDLITVSLGDLLFTFIFIFFGSWLLGMDKYIAITLGILGMTVSPVGVLSVIKEHTKGGNFSEFSQNVLTMVAIDNLLCTIIFGVVSAIIQALTGSQVGGANLAFQVLWELLLAIGIGVVVGNIILYLIRIKTNNNKLLVYLLSFVLLNTGIANYFGISALLINMTTGAIVTNFSVNKMLLVQTFERVELPIIVMFLTLAGAKLDLKIVSSVGLIGAVYIGGRLGGKILGSYTFSQLTKLSKETRKNIGMALTPQASVAIGLSILAEEKILASNGIITGVVLTGVIFFEIVGPLLVNKALNNMEPEKSTNE